MDEVKETKQPDPQGIKTKVDVQESRVDFGKVDFSKAQGARFYANHAGSNVTMFDIRLVFSDIDVSGEGVVANSTLTVLMSPELAELSYQLLGKALQHYKQAYGDTRIKRGAAHIPPNPTAE